MKTYHITFLRIGHHTLHPVSNTLFGQTTGEFFACASLTAIKHYQAPSGAFQFLDEGIVTGRLKSNRCGSEINNNNVTKIFFKYSNLK